MNDAPDAIWFDLDNTLIDRHLAIRHYLKSCWAPTHNDVLNHWLTLDDWGYAPREVVCGAIALTCVDASTDDVWQHMRQNLGRFVPKNQSLLKQLKRLMSHTRCLVVSNGSGINQRNKMQHAGLLDLFDEKDILISGEHGVAKPDQAFFELAWQRTPFKKSKIIMVGDHLMQDCQGAKTFGVNAGWVSHQRKKSMTIQPDLYIENLESWIGTMSYVKGTQL